VPRPTLVALDYSPWSQKAAWALHLRGVEVRFAPYTPTLSEPWLRVRRGRLRGKVSVPVLLGTANGAIEGSWEIARWAASKGDGPELFPDLAEVKRWNDLGDEALAVGRRRTVEVMVDDPASLDEASAKKYPAFAAPLLRPVARAIARRTMNKYETHSPERLPEVLDALRSVVEEQPYLVGDAISYADIAMAVVLEVVSPGPQARRGPAETRNWSDPDLAARYQDLIAWRDRVLDETGFRGVGR